jgi:CubicO group peptidase (beta-lactamase class C family)
MMTNRTPRTFLLGADLQPPIARERENILATFDKDDVPGAAVCLVYQGKPVWIEGFGVTDRQSRRPVGTGTISHFFANTVLGSPVLTV